MMKSNKNGQQHCCNPVTQIHVFTIYNIITKIISHPSQM